MNNKKILILEGGYNEEHDVSLKTSLEVQKILKKKNLKYKILKVNPKDFDKKILKYKNYICFNALHGPFGEDGQIQKILKKNNIKFTHSGFLSSKNCFDKLLTKNIISKNKILTPKFSILNKHELNYDNLLLLKKKYKQFVIKPNKSGSSFGINIIKNNRELEEFCNTIKKYKKELSEHEKILVEEYISGKELTVSTIKYDNKIDALAVTEIIFKSNFFDYKAKYSRGYARHILPANISKANYRKLLNISSQCHKLLKCKSIARSDFILSRKNNKIYFLEINTQPGLTSVSLLPEQANYRKIPFENIILTILKNIN